MWLSDSSMLPFVPNNVKLLYNPINGEVESRPRFLEKDKPVIGGLSRL